MATVVQKISPSPLLMGVALGMALTAGVAVTISHVIPIPPLATVAQIERLQVSLDTYGQVLTAQQRLLNAILMERAASDQAPAPDGQAAKK